MAASASTTWLKKKIGEFSDLVMLLMYTADTDRKIISNENINDKVHQEFNSLK